VAQADRLWSCPYGCFNDDVTEDMTSDDATNDADNDGAIETDETVVLDLQHAVIDSQFGIPNSVDFSADCPHIWNWSGYDFNRHDLPRMLELQQLSSQPERRGFFVDEEIGDARWMRIEDACVPWKMSILADDIRDMSLDGRAYWAVTFFVPRLDGEPEIGCNWLGALQPDLEEAIYEGYGQMLLSLEGPDEDDRYSDRGAEFIKRILTIANTLDGEHGVKEMSARLARLGWFDK
ncbi:MAG: hypothetical protein WA057_01305, partial [Candidatus Magasanikiibacteriota bacterium]